MTMTNLWLALGAISAFLSVALGAFGAHALAERLEPRLLAVFQTGTQYQMMHALALLVLGLLCQSRPEAGAHSLSTWTGVAFSVGTVLFSGSLYALALSGVRALGAITPLGGVSFLGGWVLLTLLILRTKA